MADGRGGYQRPSNPAPVSGPGALSRRTDGQAAQQVTGMPYGENADFYDLQTQATMARAQSVAGGVNASAPAPAPVVGLGDPTQYPDEPITTGIDSGEGAGSEVLAAPSVLSAQDEQDKARIAALLPIYARIAERPDASNAFRNFYRYLRSQV
jgi:hypothetical protein